MDETKSKLIDKYLNEALSAEEEKSFQAYMHEAEFAEEVEFRKMLGSANREGGRTKLKELFKEVDKELDAVPNTTSVSGSGRKMNLYPWIGVAAVILALLAFWLWPSAATDAELFAAHYTPFPNLVAPIDKGTDIIDLDIQALHSYERGNYKDAVRLFEELGESDQLDINEQLYYGLSLLMEERNVDAITQLQAVVADKTARYHQAAQWYLSLAYIKAQNRASGKRVLDEILEKPDHIYREKALELLEKI